MGYTPLFDTLLNGTMYGKWPHNGIWALLLSRASREGVINEVPESLAAHIGISVEQLMASIAFFMQPDPNSRTPDDDGRRLELLDEHKAWGWRIINHGKYREKARKNTYDSERTESGRDAARKKAERAASMGVPTRPDASRDVPLSYASPNASPTPEASPSQRDAEVFDLLATIKTVYPAGMHRGDHWLLAEREIAKRLDEGATPEGLLSAAREYGAQQEAMGNLRTESVLRPNNFFNGTGAWRGPFPIPQRKSRSAADRLTWRPEE
jgi:hypothetical protein